VHRATVVIELEELELAARDLAAGGVFVPDCVLRLGEECDVVVRTANQQIWLPARAVYVDDRGGAGLELLGFSSEVKAQLAELDPIETSRVGAGGRRAADPEELVALIDLEALADADPDDQAAEEDDLAIPIAAEPFEARPAGDPDADPDDGDDDHDALLDDGADHDDDALLDAADDDRDDHDVGADAAAPADDDHDRYASVIAVADDDGEPLADDEVVDPEDRDGADALRLDDDPGEPSTSARGARHVHERLRGLNLAAQIKLAAAGDQHERILLERLYGKNVWETLLRNPRLTAPEVARIARYGSLPRVLLEVILANNAWLQVPEIRRALLSNPRLASDQIMKVLRLTPKYELKLAAVQSSYPPPVRTAAKVLLRDC
jgi:hypothetical protein